MENNQLDCTETCGCRPTRRQTIKGIALGVAAALSPRLAMAGPFESADFEKLVPANKKLSPRWVQSLFARGTRTVYKGDDLKYIGMPVGGLCAGQLYLGGDGTLWHWDLFNQEIHTGDAHYAHPVLPQSPVDQGFRLRITSGDKTQERTLDRKGFPGVTFCGEYPIGFVEYKDAECPVTVSLEAFSPFIPLNADDSSLPATVLRFTLKNTSTQKIEAELIGWLENANGLHTGGHGGKRRNRVAQGQKMLLLECGALPPDPVARSQIRPPIVFADFEGNDYGQWKVKGEAFGKGPARGATAPNQHLSGFQGKSLANSLLGGSDQPQGKLTSPTFTIERPYINFLIGGGRHAKETCINLLVEEKVVRTETGKNTDAMDWASWEVRDLAGKTAKIEIVDRHSGGWGHIDIDQIEFADEPRQAGPPFAKLPDIGTLALALLAPAGADTAAAATDNGPTIVPISHKLVGSLTRKISLDPGQSHTATFVLSWRFPNLTMPGIKGGTGRYYATKFGSAGAVSQYVAENFDRLYGQTKLWHDTWYDSSLPYWFLDRTHLNISILATSTAMRFANGRFYGWEGVGCCDGTCTHVWQYEQAMGRLFPEFDILLRERCDFNPDVAFHPGGWIGHRGEHLGPAVDGQAGTILRAYRDHQMSPNDAFLKRNWAAIKKAIGWLIAQDGNGDGILGGAQHNTLDAEWFGSVPWLSGLYLAALRAGEEMAHEMSDSSFSSQCRSILDIGLANFVKRMWNGEYFVQIPDPKHKDTVGSYDGCEIDQVMGQSWAYQVGLGRLWPEKENKQAMAAIWKYNFTPDVGPYRNAHKPGRWYAMPGEAGLLMCTWPRGEGSRIRKAFDYYFNECMNGFEHEAASHMIWEGMLREGLAVERALHDRYHASRRNPWNEVECGDHYARSMASYGSFIAACGYAYHGPKGYLAFVPRLNPENFKAAFTAAEGWGSFSQKHDGNTLRAAIDLLWGKLRLKTLHLKLPAEVAGRKVIVSLAGKPVEATAAADSGNVRIQLTSDAVMNAGQQLTLVIE